MTQLPSNPMTRNILPGVDVHFSPELLNQIEEGKALTTIRFQILASFRPLQLFLSQSNQKRQQIGVFLGILGGIGLAFFYEYFDHSLKKLQDVTEKLHLPLLASIPYLRK